MRKIISYYRIIFVLLGMNYFMGLDGICQNGYTKTVVSGKRWKITQERGSHFPSIYHDLVITCDTTHLNGKIYRNLEFNRHGDCGIGGYIREDTIEQRVYYINELDQDLQEILIADYSLEKGDTFEFDNGWGKQVVDTIRYVNLYGNQNLKLVWFGGQVLDYFIEGVGRWATGPINRCQDYTFVSELEYTDLNCSTITTVESIKNDDKFVVSPNPVKEQLRITFSKDLVKFPIPFEIRGPTGEFYINGSINSIESYVNMEKMPSGILFIIFRYEGKKIVKTVVHYWGAAPF